jgi:hypothetical protein
VVNNYQQLKTIFGNPVQRYNKKSSHGNGDCIMEIKGNKAKEKRKEPKIFSERKRNNRSRE